MIIVDTPHHITFSSAHERPVFACSGACQKVWWLIELATAKQSHCPQCGGQLITAEEHTHYTVVNQAQRDLTLDDFRQTFPMDNNDQRTVEGLLKGGAKINNLSMVKPQFEEKAKAHWVTPKLHS